MRQKIAKAIIALTFVAAAIICLLVAGFHIYKNFSRSGSRELVIRASAENDPYQLELSTGANKFIRRVILPDSTEVGIIRTADGNDVRYWFRSHHLSDDLGSSRFVFPGGRERIVSGYFCCEVMFSQKDFRSIDELDSFLAKVDGTSP